MHVVSVLGARQPTGMRHLSAVRWRGTRPALWNDFAIDGTVGADETRARRSLQGGPRRQDASVCGAEVAPILDLRASGRGFARAARRGALGCCRMGKLLGMLLWGRYVHACCVRHAAGGARLACIANPSAISWPVKQLPLSVSRSLIYLLGKTRGTWCDRTATYLRRALPRVAQP